MKLFLIRHGESYVNLPDYDSNVDSGLTPLGQSQARKLGQWLPTQIETIHQLYCSTMERARETAVPIIDAYGNLPVIYDDHIREIGTVRRDHTPFPADALPAYANFWGSERPFASLSAEDENGESLSHFRSRVGIFIEQIVKQHEPHENVVVVCHSGVIETFVDLIFNVGIWKRSEVWSHNTGVTHFEYVNHPTREAWRMYYHSRIDHLTV